MPTTAAMAAQEACKTSESAHSIVENINKQLCSGDVEGVVLNGADLTGDPRRCNSDMGGWPASPFSSPLYGDVTDISSFANTAELQAAFRKVAPPNEVQ
ncbi:hypothetical protein DIPPA_23519 [Diplonema papillatum]|nr:hypothetical protein DIPPA_23519 [Diplonema papillatum]